MAPGRRTEADESEDRAVKRSGRTEHRWPAALAILIALALYGMLPTEVMPPGIRIAVVALGLGMLIPIVILNPHRLRKQKPWSRWLSLGLAGMLALANQVALVQLVGLLVSPSDTHGHSLLVAVVQVWVTNVIAFALVYWELDRGGPIARHQYSREDMPLADFRFSQDSDQGAVKEVADRSSEKLDWIPAFLDYLYESAVGSMAFGPGAAFPLSPRAKMLMMLQSLAAFVLLALVIAYAVGELG